MKKVKQEMMKRIAKGLSAKDPRHFVRDVINWAKDELDFIVGKTKVNTLWDELEPTRPHQIRHKRLVPPDKEEVIAAQALAKVMGVAKSDRA